MASERRPMVPNRLKYLRERHKNEGGLWLTLEEAANALGYSPSTVSRHENQSRSLSDDDVQNYSRLYKVRETELFKGLTTKQRAS